ncbi:unnamed protein product [Prunus armeniaca]
MEERDNDEEESRKAVGIRVQTRRFLRLNYCICEEERTYDVDGWLDAWKVSGFMSMERTLDRIKELHAMQGMIMGASVSTVYFNLRLRHPTLEMPLIDYDLAFLFQPMLVLGISIGVAFNVMFADWMVTVLLIILFLGSRKVVGIGVQTWRWFHCKMSRFCLIEFVNNFVQVPISHNIYWKELSMLVYVSVAFLIVHIVKTSLAM